MVARKPCSSGCSAGGLHKMTTPSKTAKQLGAKSLAQVAEHWGTTVQALHYQHKTNPKKFEIIVRGVVSLLN